MKVLRAQQVKGDKRKEKIISCFLLTNPEKNKLPLIYNVYLRQQKESVPTKRLIH